MFNTLFKSQVDSLDETRRKELGVKLEWHAKGPMQTAVEYKRYVVNGTTYRIMESDITKKTQNSGVCVTTVDGPTYYGKLTRIIEVTYYDQTKYVLFRCDWADIRPNKGYKQDGYGFELVNFNNLIHTGEHITDEPFVLSSQVSQVFYVEDDRHPNWDVVVKTKPRHMFDVGEGEDHYDVPDDNYHEHEPFNMNIAGDDDIQCARTELPAIVAS
jgi:hypothetical protein